MDPIHVGMTGLATMGQNLARNIGHHGFPVAVHNRTSAKVDAFLEAYGAEGQFVGAHTPEAFASALTPPRIIIMMVKAGAPVDDVITNLRPHLARGDVLVDGGNSAFTDSERRLNDLAADGIRFLGTGVSGGEDGALHGPSLMPGGTRAAYDLVEPVFTAIAADVDGTPCCTYIGDGGAGHYVKMVHNGIEYADMQLIAEAYDLLRTGLALEPPALADVFDEWNGGDLDSFLIQITARVLRRRDDEGDGWLVDKIKDSAGQKGTGRLTAENALELGAPLTAITEAVFARDLSAAPDDRRAASRILPGPAGAGAAVTVDEIRDALYAAKIVAYAQGFDQLRRAGEAYAWPLRLGDLATIWRGGCIIRARFLDRVREVYDATPPPHNLVVAPYFTDGLARCLPALRRVVGDAARIGVAVPVFSSALAWYDGYRRERVPANLIQAQRDLFGAHTYERIDRPGAVHTDWDSP